MKMKMLLAAATIFGFSTTASHAAAVYCQASLGTALPGGYLSIDQGISSCAASGSGSGTWPTNETFSATSSSIIDLASGTVKVASTGVNVGSIVSSYASIQERILVNAPMAGAENTLTATFQFLSHGTVGHAGTAGLAIVIGGRHLAVNWTDPNWYGTDHNVVSGSTDSWEFDATLPALWRTSFDLNSPLTNFDFQLVASTSGVADFGNTFEISLILPDGVTFTSESGVFLTNQGGGPVAVPEPGTLALLGIGSLASWAISRRKRATT